MTAQSKRDSTDRGRVWTKATPKHPTYAAPRNTYTACSMSLLETTDTRATNRPEPRTNAPALQSKVDSSPTPNSATIPPLGQSSRAGDASSQEQAETRQHTPAHTLARRRQAGARRGASTGPISARHPMAKRGKRRARDVRPRESPQFIVKLKTAKGEIMPTRSFPPPFLSRSSILQAAKGPATLDLT